VGANSETISDFIDSAGTPTRHGHLIVLVRMYTAGYRLKTRPRDRIQTSDQWKNHLKKDDRVVKAMEPAVKWNVRMAELMLETVLLVACLIHIQSVPSLKSTGRRR
jgi:hypothetical protein